MSKSRDRDNCIAAYRLYLEGVFETLVACGHQDLIEHVQHLIDEALLNVWKEGYAAGFEDAGKRPVER